MSAVDPRAEFACDRETVGGLRVVYDDGQNVRVEGMAPCPWCGEVRDDPYLRPYVQVSGGTGRLARRARCARRAMWRRRWNGRTRPTSWGRTET